MRIRIHDITDKGVELESEEKAEKFPILSEMVRSGECEFLAPIRVRVRAFQVRRLIEVEGSFGTRVRLACSRCLKDFEIPLEGKFALTFTRELPERKETDPEGVELTAEEMGLILFSGEEIDLLPAVQEQVVLAFPIRALCGDACKGLCPRCGEDLNLGACGCEPEEADERFSILRNFKPASKR